MGTNNANNTTVLRARRRAAALACAAGAALALSGTARAVTYTYTPAGTSDQWSLGTNWSATPVGAPGTRLTFVADNATVLPASQISNASNDIPGTFQLNILDLQGTGPATANANAGVWLPRDGHSVAADGADTP